MTKEVRSVDIDSIPELAELAEEVHHSGQEIALCRGKREIARISPAIKVVTSKEEWFPQAVDWEALKKTRGGWKGVDADALLEAIYESRNLPSTRPPVEL